MINRLIFWLSLGGMILAVHLWIQKARGFDQGCLGLAKPVVAMMDTGCREVDMLPASHLLGVSNAAWGFSFYFALALLSLGKIVSVPRWARVLHGLSEAGVCLGLLYSGYLVFTMIVGGKVCVLCLASAGLVLVLFALHAGMRRLGGFQPVAETARGRELGFASLGMFAAAGMLVAVLLFVNRLGTRPLDQGASLHELERVIGQTLPVFIDERRLEEMRACRFDTRVASLDVDALVPRSAPFIGKVDGLPVIAFYDPSCPHCATHFPQFLNLAERFKDRARFTILPRLIGTRWMIQMAALKLAEPTGKYFELWEKYFTREPGKVTPATIVGHFRELGLDVTDLENRLRAKEAELPAEASRYRDAGIDVTPTILIGGKRVFGRNVSAECLARLIEQELAAAGR